jgi:MFS family permease
VSALTGPQLVKVTDEMFAVPFLGTYLAAMAVTLIGMPLFLLLDLPAPPRGRRARQAAPTWLELLARPRIRVAVICGMVSYALMNLVMTSAPLAMVGCGYTTGNAADGLSMHVLAMFIPSFFTGHLIARYGAERIVLLGLLILAGAGAFGLSGVDLTHFFGTLILLGLGWNFGFIGATAMLTSAYRLEERARAQGMNDSIVMGCVTVASLSSGGLMNCMAGSAEAGWQLVNIAMAPFLVLAGAALIWLALRPRAAA